MLGAVAVAFGGKFQAKFLVKGTTICDVRRVENEQVQLGPVHDYRYAFRRWSVSASARQIHPVDADVMGVDVSLFYRHELAEVPAQRDP